MAEVIVTLSLTRKSGILAAAVSSLARNGLEFKSHRFVEGDDEAVLQVELMADGEVGDSGALAESLERIRGVDSVADIGVDGQSLLNGAASADIQRDAEPVAEAASSEVDDIEVEDVEAAVAEPHAESTDESDSETLSANDSEAASADASAGKNNVRRPMIRRRRRFT